MSNEIDVPGHLQAILSEMRKVAAEQRALTASIDVFAEVLDQRAAHVAKERVDGVRDVWSVLNDHRARLERLGEAVREVHRGVDWLNGEVRSLGARLRALEPGADDGE